MRIAVVDVGTNTTRLYIAEVSDGAVTAELTRLSRVTRLGAGVDSSGRLADDALEREYAALSEYRALLDEAPVDRAVAVMTSAVRDAANGPELAETLSSRFGLDARIISGDEEARLTYLGATSDHAQPVGDARGQGSADASRHGAGDARRHGAAEARRHGAADTTGPTLVVDIGGGSTEVVLGHGDALAFHVSTQAGVVRQADRHITSDPPTAEELAALAADVRQVLEDGVPPERRAGVGRALGVAGTPTVLAAIAQSLEPYDPERVHGYILTAGERDAIFTHLKRMPLEERRHVPGLHPDRANVILPGIVILTEVMNLFGLNAIEVSEHDILRGAALAYS